MRIVYSAQFRDSSGYASAARGYLKSIDYLLQQDPSLIDEFYIHSIDLEDNPALSEEDKKLVDKHEFQNLDDIDNFMDNGDYILLWHHPPVMLDVEWITQTPKAIYTKKLLYNSKVNVNLTVWEADDIPKMWDFCYDRYNTSGVIVPCSWNLNTFKQHFKDNMGLYMVPHHLSTKRVAKTPLKHIENLIKDKFVIFSMSQWQNRKGYDKLLKSYFMEFGGSDDVVFVLKTYLSTARGGPSVEEQVQVISNEINYFKQSVFYGEQKDFPKIILVPGLVSEENLSWLYDKADLFALATRGEGFGLTIADSILHGCPVLVPNKGGHIDFVPGNNFKIEGHWAPYEYRPEYTCNMNWYEPHINSIRYGFREAYRQWQSGELKIKGDDSKKALLKNRDYSRKNVGVGVIRALVEENQKYDLTNALNNEQIENNTLARLKQQVQESFSLEKKLEILKDSYKDQECYILACGPSLTEYDEKYLREILKNKLVLSVKQAYNRFSDITDFHFFNCSNLPKPDKNGNYYNYNKNSTPITIGSSNYHLGQRWNSLKQPCDIFFKIPIRTDVNEFICQTGNINKYLIRNRLERPCGPGIMFETVMFTALHLGVNKITAIGWDLNKNVDATNPDQHEHFYGSTQEMINRGDIQEWEMKANREFSEVAYKWMESSGIKLQLASTQSALYEGIPRVSL